MKQINNRSSQQLMRCNQSRQAQKGFSFLELSFVLIVLGLLTSLMAEVVPAMRRASATAETVRNLTSVEFSLESFASIHGRLPCADTDGDGLENGSGSTCEVIGKLPYITLGYSGPLVNADGYDFKYSLYNRSSSSLRSDASLGSNTERYRPLIGVGVSALPVTLTEKPLTSRNGRLDFCQGLRAGMDTTFDTRFLYVQTKLGSKKHVAYVLVDPGVGNMDLTGDMFDGLNGSASSSEPKFDHPNRTQSLTYDDRVVVAYFDQMWEQLGCSANMATAGRAQPNVETTLALLVQTMGDYKTQLNIAVDSAYADQFSAGAGVTGAATGLLSGIASLPASIAASITSAGIRTGAVVASGIAIGLSTAAVILAAVNLAETVKTHNEFKQYRTDFDTLINNKLNPLYTDVQADVQRSGTLVFSDQ